MADTPTAPVVRIRPTTAADLDAFVDIYCSMAEHHASLSPARYRVPERAAVRARFAEIGADDENLHLVAEVDGRVIAHLDAYLDPVTGPGSQRRPTAAASIGVAVLDGYRGLGVGSALMEAADRWARERGLLELRLEVAAENTGAHRLYERLGYEPLTHTLAKRLG
jgi:GNAT superfamily N-acetyltransferase